MFEKKRSFNKKTCETFKVDNSATVFHFFAKNVAKLLTLRWPSY